MVTSQKTVILMFFTMITLDLKFCIVMELRSYCCQHGMCSPEPLPPRFALNYFVS
jgi:hypothetical protein